MAHYYVNDDGSISTKKSKKNKKQYSSGAFGSTNIISVEPEPTSTTSKAPRTVKSTIKVDKNDNSSDIRTVKTSNNKKSFGESALQLAGDLVKASNPVLISNSIAKKAAKTTTDAAKEVSKETESKKSFSETTKQLKDNIKNSATKSNGLSVSSVITDAANLADSAKDVAETVPVLGGYVKMGNIAKKTAGNIATNMGEGALKNLEGTLDMANNISDTINNPLTYAANKKIYGKKVADEALKRDKKNQKEFIKRNLTQELEDATGFTDMKKDWEKGSLVKSENVGGQVAQGVGGMVPSLVAGRALGFDPKLIDTQGLTGKAKLLAQLGNVGRTYIGQLPSNALLASSSYGSGVEEALNEGATMKQAQQFGLLNAAIEQGTEMLTGGVPGLKGQGGVDQFVEPLIGKAKNPYARAALKSLYKAVGEGGEEWVSEMLQPLAKKTYSNEPIDWKEALNRANQSFLTGTLTGAVLNGPESISYFSNARAESRVSKLQNLNDIEKSALTDLTIKRKNGEKLNQSDIEQLNYLRDKVDNIEQAPTQTTEQQAPAQQLSPEEQAQQQYDQLKESTRKTQLKPSTQQEALEALRTNEQAQQLTPEQQDLQQELLQEQQAQQALEEQQRERLPKTEKELLDAIKNNKITSEDKIAEAVRAFNLAQQEDTGSGLRGEMADVDVAIPGLEGIRSQNQDTQNDAINLDFNKNQLESARQQYNELQNELQKRNQAETNQTTSNLETYSQKDINRFSTNPDNLINNVNGEVSSFINEYYDSKTKKGKKMPIGSKIKKMFFGRINTNVSNILNALLENSKYKGQYDTTGTNVVMSSNNIQHIFNKHGNEYRKGQINVTPENLSKYSEVIGNPDYVGLSSKESRGETPTFLFTKKINGYSVAVEVLSSKKQLYPESYYVFESKSREYNDFIKNNKLKKAENVVSNESIDSLDSNAQGDTSVAFSDKNISRNSENVNVSEAKSKPVVKAETTGKEGEQYFKDLGADENVAKVLSEMPKPEKQSLSERIETKKANLSEAYQYFRRNYVDKGDAIYTLGKKTKNPQLYATYDKMGTAIAEANNNIGESQANIKGKKYNNFTDANGKKASMSLNQIWEGIDPQIANEYLAHYRNVDTYNQVNENGRKMMEELQPKIKDGSMTVDEANEILRNNEGTKYVFSPKVTDQDSLKVIKQLESQHPELKRFGKNVWQYGYNQLQNMVDSGLISQQQADQYMKDNEHYVRMQRDVQKPTKGVLEFDRNGKAKVNNQIQEMQGSTKNILPFKDSMAKYTLDVAKAIRMNQFGQELFNTVNMGSTDNTINSLDEGFGVNPEILKANEDGTYSLTVFKDGVATVVPINKGIYEALTPNKHYEFEKYTKPIRTGDSLRKSLLTDKNPLFLATNMMKDAFDAPLNSKHPVAFVKNYPRAIKQIATNGEYYQQYKALGGLQNTYFDYQGFKKQGSKLNPFTWIEKGNNAIEQFPRLAEFMSTMESGGTVEEAMYNAAEVTTNFKRGGEVTKAANRNGVTFLNASVQGFDKFVRNFTDIQSPRQATQMLAKAIVLGIGPGLLNDAMWDDDDEYKELQEYQKDNYYLFKGKNGNWIRIPKGRAVSIFQSAARRTKYFLKGDKDAYKGLGELVANQIAPNNPFENNIISPIVDVARNKSWSGNPIVNQSMEKRPKAEQYNEKTDEFSKWIGKKLNVSPMKVNYIIDQYSGVIGDLTLPSITPRSSSDTSNPFVAATKSKFSFNAANSSKSVSTFYDTKDELEIKKNSTNAKPIDRVKSSYMASQNIKLSALYNKQKQIQSNPKLSKKEKYDKALEVQKEINKFSKQAVDNVNNIEKNEYYVKIGDYYYKKVREDGKDTYKRDTSKKIPTEKYALYDYFRDKYYKSKGR